LKITLDAVEAMSAAEFDAWGVYLAMEAKEPKKGF
jgi:hypothetical protein